MAGISIYLLVTISLIVTKIIYWYTFSFWWIFLPAALTILLVLILLVREVYGSSRSRAQPTDE
jgi:membrane protein YdbS with pleckstrin-like domain